VDDHPEAMLVAGWGSTDFMADLLRELDHGLSALPAGSEVVFVNSHPAADSLGVVLRSVSLENVMVRGVGGRGARGGAEQEEVGDVVAHCRQLLHAQA
jgi:hypothetical protein